jgi:predicted acetyltransferase
MTIVVRAIERSEYETFSNVAMQTFGGEVLEGVARDRLLEVLDLERTYAAFDGEDLVGTAGSFTFELMIPGASIPMAGFTLVSVRPSHRRRGVLRAMVAKHNQDMLDRGEAISGLWASETSIYPRFGYGLAAESYLLETDTRHLKFKDEAGGDEIRLIDTDEALRRLAPIYARFMTGRPGMYARSSAWWKWRSLYDGIERRGGASSMRIAVARRGDEDVGYILYRQTFAMERGIMAGSAKIIELLGEDQQAEASLWRFACHLDLYPKLTWWNAPVDTALPWLAGDRRHVHRNRMDTLWLHLLDIPAALQARRYEADGAFSFSLGQGEAMNEVSTYQLVVEDGAGICQSYDGEPDLHLSRQTLSSLYLGAFRAKELSALGRLRGSDDAIRLADRVLGTSTPPWCPEVF